MICSHCQGTGKTQHREPLVKGFENLGWRQVDRRCVACSGTGQTRLVPFPQTCVACGGSGVIPGELKGYYPSGMPARARHACTDCGGSGKRIIAAELPDFELSGEATKGF